MGNRPLCDDCYGYRSNDGCVELQPFFSDRNELTLRVDVPQGIRRD